MNPTPFELALMREMLLNPRRRIVGAQHYAEHPRTVNPPGSASPEVRAARAKQKAADRRKKSARKASRR